MHEWLQARRPNASQEALCPTLRRVCMAKPMSKLGTMLQVGRTFGMRDGMLRLEYELQRGSGLMSWRMRSVQGWDSWNLNALRPPRAPKKCSPLAGMADRQFFFADARSGSNSKRNHRSRRRKVCAHAKPSAS